MGAVGIGVMAGAQALDSSVAPPAGGDAAPSEVPTSAELGSTLGSSNGKSEPDENLETPNRDDAPNARNADEAKKDEHLIEPDNTTDSQEAQRAEEVVVEAFESLSESASDDPVKIIDEALPQVAQGALLAELQAQVAEYDSLGWQQEGAPTVSDVEILKVDKLEKPTLIIIQACVDWSSVKYVDGSGNLLPPSDTPRAFNIFTLERIDNTEQWTPIAREFSDDPAC